MASAYQKANGKYLRQNQWEDITSDEKVKTFFENIYLDNEITVNVIDDGVLLR